jgi:FixJ family two-component response regulator
MLDQRRVGSKDDKERLSEGFAQQRGRRSDLLLHPFRRRHRIVSDLPGTLVGLVDDDPSVRKGLARLVKSAGYRVEVFASARDFLTRPQQEDPSCLLIDVRMPGLTGLELQDALAVAGRRMSIVFVSGHGDVAGSVKAMKGGAVDFLTKPVDARELLSAIERAVAQAFRTQREQAGAMDVQGRLKTLTARRGRSSRSW